MIDELSRAHAEPSRATLARAFFRFLESENVPYVFMGDPRSVDSGSWGDLDVVIDDPCISKLPSLITRFCEAQGLLWVQVLRHEWNGFYLVLARPAHSVHPPLFFHPDVCGTYVRRARRLLTASELLGRRLRTQPSAWDPGFFVPPPAMAFLAYVLKKIDKQQLERPHEDFLQYEWAQDPTGCCAQLHRFWSPRSVDLIVRALKLGQWDPVRRMLPALRRELRRRVRRSPADCLRELRRCLSRLSNPTGYWLAFLGPDGAGKSTIAARVVRDLAPAFRKHRTYHLRPHVGRRSQSNTPVLDPHALPLRGFLASVAKLAFWWLDYTLGFFVDIFPRLASSTLVVFDRHYWDLRVDPIRYRFRGSMRMVDEVGRRMFQPSLFVVLDAPVSMLHARKCEVTEHEADRQRNEYRKLAASRKHAHIVDASRRPEEVSAEVNRLVLENLANRTARRLGLASLPSAARRPEREASTRWPANPS